MTDLYIYVDTTSQIICLLLEKSREEKHFSNSKQRLQMANSGKQLEVARIFTKLTV